MKNSKKKDLNIYNKKLFEVKNNNIDRIENKSNLDKFINYYEELI